METDQTDAIESHPRTKEEKDYAGSKFKWARKLKKLNLLSLLVSAEPLNEAMTSAL